MPQLDLETIGSYVKDHLSEWLEKSYPSESERRLNLIERVIRVEEAIERLTEMIRYQNEMTNRRFEDMLGQMDKRFSELREDMNRRFSTMQWTMFFGFTLISALVTIYRFLETAG